MFDNHNNIAIELHMHYAVNLIGTYVFKCDVAEIAAAPQIIGKPPPHKVAIGKLHKDISVI